MLNGYTFVAAVVGPSLSVIDPEQGGDQIVEVLD